VTAIIAKAEGWRIEAGARSAGPRVAAFRLIATSGRRTSFMAWQLGSILDISAQGFATRFT